MMNNELRIERYLLELDRELRALPVSQKADIITEMKSHVYAVLEKDPQRPLEFILTDLGNPKIVAARYLASKGIVNPPPARRGQWMKWLAIGTVGLFAMIFVSGLAVIWYLSPIVKVDKENGRVQLLGGMIDVNEKIGRVHIGGVEVSDGMKDGIKVRGQDDLTGQNITLIKIPFNTAKLEVRSTKNQTMTWDCKATNGDPLKAQVVAGILTLNLDSLNLAKCTIGLPMGTATEFHGVNGHMEIENPSDSLDISLTNGKVNIHPDPSRVYNFEVKVKNGLQDIFPHSVAKDAVKVKVDVLNGVVKRE